MGVMLSGELSGLLAEAGGRWPEADEDRLHEVADSWRTLAQDLRTTAADGTAVAGRVSAINTGPAVDAFSAYWTELRADLEQAATAAEQTAEGVDAMARGTLGAKKSIVGALQATHSEIQTARSMPVVGAVIGPAVGLLLGILLRVILRILAALLKLIWKFIVWLFKKIAEFFKWLWNKLFGPKPKPQPGGGGAKPPGVKDGWVSRPADNGKGTVYQRPGAQGNADMVRVMNPTPNYPNGYVRFYNKHGQPVGLDGKPGPPSATHIPRNPDGSYPVPQGW